MPETISQHEEAEQAYRAGVHRACERAQQESIAEFNRRVRQMAAEGVGADEAGYRVHAEMEAYNRDMRVMLADDMLLEEAEFRRAISG